MGSAQDTIQKLLEANPLREPVLRQVIQSLRLLPGSRGLDAGCGIGLQAALLAEAIGSEGTVVGVDLDIDLLAYAKQYVQRLGLADQIRFEKSDVGCLPFEDESFDWVWSADCVGYPLGELAPILAELLRVLKPGGWLYLLGWTSQQLLPGYPFLEARLNATCSAYLPYMSGKNPELNFMRALRAFQEAGLQETKARTFAGDLQGPLNLAERAGLTSLFDMLWGQPQPEVSAADWAAYQRLCLPGSPDLILDVPGYYAFFTYSLFQGQKSGLRAG